MEFEEERHAVVEGTAVTLEYCIFCGLLLSERSIRFVGEGGGVVWKI